MRSLIVFVMVFIGSLGPAYFLLDGGFGEEAAGGLRVAETPAEGQTRPMRPDPRLSTFKPVDGGGRAGSKTRSSAGADESIQEEWNREFGNDGLQPLRLKMLEAARRVDADPCDMDARRDLVAAIKAIQKAKHIPDDSPFAPVLADPDEVPPGCSG